VTEYGKLQDSFRDFSESDLKRIEGKSSYRMIKQYTERVTKKRLSTLEKSDWFL